MPTNITLNRNISSSLAIAPGRRVLGLTGSSAADGMVIAKCCSEQIASPVIGNQLVTLNAL
jgi:hypothetical protein